MNLQNQLDYDPTLLDGVVVPNEIDTDILKSEIMLQCGLLTPIYSEPYLMKSAIAQWFAARTWTFAHLVKIIQAEYSPIENTEVFDSTERNVSESEFTSESNTGSSAFDREGESSGGRDRQRSASETADNENTVSAFNASTYQPQNSGNDSTLSSESENYQDSSSQSETGSETNDNQMERESGRQFKETFTQHKHGNIGTMTFDKLIGGELALLRNFNIYKWIAMNFRSELFIEIY